MKHEPVELLAPAGNWDCATAAVENGADAVYFGLDSGFNARARASNISEATLPSFMKMLRERGVRGYLTLNTLVFSDELERFEEVVRVAAIAGVDAVLLQDIGVALLAREVCPGLERHASTQMTMTSAECIDAVESLELSRVVLARELSTQEIDGIHGQTEMPLEAFAHGALCVAYSGQCLTSESLGGRSANRGQCAQACRLPYELHCDGKRVDLGDQKYLLSPQDLAAHALIPEMLSAGVRCFKIEGRLKSPEYVANITQKYRQALDAALEGAEHSLTAAEVSEMELSFSRGFSPGWLQGCDHKMLVPGLSSAKRGVKLGNVLRTTRDGVVVRLTADVKLGDGIAITGQDASQDANQGGRVFELISAGQSRSSASADETVEVRLERGKLDFDAIDASMQVWKTDDPKLTKRLRQTFSSTHPQYRLPLEVRVEAAAGETLRIAGKVTRNGRTLAASEVISEQPLEAARKHPLSIDTLKEQLGRLGKSRFFLARLDAEIHADAGAGAGAPMAPLSMLNQLRQQLVTELESQLGEQRPREVATGALRRLRQRIHSPRESELEQDFCDQANLHVVCRSLDQLQHVAQCRAGCAGGSDASSQLADISGVLIADFQDIREYRRAVEIAQEHDVECWLATPRIQKPGEMGIFRAMLKHAPAGILVRNLAGLRFFRDHVPVAADASLNAANELTAFWLREQGAARVTASYDLNREQLASLLDHCPTGWLEVVIHQHMPMFHMEHCVFCAVLSPGTNKHNCGRPCDDHEVRLEDRVGKQHRLHADVGCRNTLFNATPQSAAELAPTLLDRQVRHFRVELLDDSAELISKTLRLYSELLQGRQTGKDVWQSLQAANRVGVTRGTLEEPRNPLAIL